MIADGEVALLRRHAVLVVWLGAQASLAFWWVVIDGGGSLRDIGYVAALTWLLAPGSWLVFAVFWVYDALMGIPFEALGDRQIKAVLVAFWVGSASFSYVFWARAVPAVYRYVRKGIGHLGVGEGDGAAEQ